ncbi:MAG TPA: OsmC family protein [Acidimicrobiales bacterium]
MTSDAHEYRSELAWSGSTGGGYDAYPRTHWVRAEPADQELTLSGDQAFGGDPLLLNPEQLVVAAASSCQLLSFLAVAARARIDVVDYRDAATAVMPAEPEPMSIARIELSPIITIAPPAGEDGPSDERLAHLCEVAHRECFVANSLRTEVVVTPKFLRA